MSERPHLLLITTDHWPASLLGIAGHPAIQTPTLDHLARNGIHYTNAYSECPICIPARRSLMTGTPPRGHGDRTFQTTLPMPDMPTLASTFSDAGYQTYAVGKLHVFPQRDRIGFDDVILVEEGRPQWGTLDDYEIALGEQGVPGEQFLHGMSNNEYVTRPWHLDEELHPTNWTTRQMCKMIRRRDPTRPGFWYLAYTHPHPPLAPLRDYLAMYDDIIPPPRPAGNWAHESRLPYYTRSQKSRWNCDSETQITRALRAFYALCTQIDHQIRLVLGTLREEGLLDNTVIMFSSDHGDMLGHHGLWAKRFYYEQSANVPMLLMGAKNDPRIPTGTTDSRLVGWQDVMPTLLDLANVEIPETVMGQAMLSETPREYFYGECNEGVTASRMIHDGRHKLIYYPAGNRTQLFDLEADPQEVNDLGEHRESQSIREHLTDLLLTELYGSDEEWLTDGKLTGLAAPEHLPKPQRDLLLQRGLHWPPPPVVPPEES